MQVHSFVVPGKPFIQTYAVDLGNGALLADDGGRTGMARYVAQYDSAQSAQIDADQFGGTVCLVQLPHLSPSQMAL